MNEITPEIRKANVDDIESLTPLFKELDALHVEMMPENFKPFEGPTRPVELLQQKVASLDKALFIALQGTKVAGFVDVQKSSNPPTLCLCREILRLLITYMFRQNLEARGLLITCFRGRKSGQKNKAY